MFDRFREIFRLSAAWRSAADTVCAAMCGAFSALGMLAFGSPEAVAEDWFSVVAAVMLALFLLLSAYGVFRSASRLPKYAFALAQIAAVALCPQYWSHSVMLVLYIPLFAMLVLAVDWRGAQLAALPLSLVFAWSLSGVDEEAPEVFPEASFLPVTLLAERQGARVLAVGDDLPYDWWGGLDHVSAVDRLEPSAAARRLSRCRGGYDLAVAGAPTREAGFRRELYRLLSMCLEKRGVLVFPAADIGLLPPGNWHFIRLPGASGAWLAAGNGFMPESDPEVLDRRLQDFSGAVPATDRILLPGAFAALYLPEPQFVDDRKKPESETTARSGSRLWAAVGLALWLLLRLWGCRGERIAAAVASGENMAAMALYTLAVLPLWQRGELYTGIPPRLLAAGVGLLLLPLDTSRRWWIFVCAALGALPLCLFGQVWFMSQICWFFWMLSGAFAMSWLRHDEPGTVWIGAAGGVLAGTAVYVLLRGGAAPAFPTALALSVLLRIGILLRR